MDPAIMGLIGLVADCVALAAVRMQQSRGVTWQFYVSPYLPAFHRKDTALTKDVSTLRAKDSNFGQLSRFVAFAHHCLLVPEHANAGISIAFAPFSWNSRLDPFLLAIP